MSGTYPQHFLILSEAHQNILDQLFSFLLISPVKEIFHSTFVYSHEKTHCHFIHPSTYASVFDSIFDID
jgi:hypothetical protein